MGKHAWSASKLARAVIGALALAMAIAPTTTGPAAAAPEDPAPTYLLRHTQSGQYVASDGWGPSVLASTFNGGMAQWHQIVNADGTVSFRNAGTGAFLDRVGGTNGHMVGVTPQQAPTAAWNVVDTGVGLTISNGGAFLVANGFTVRTSTEAGPQGLWELVPVEPTPARFVSMTNELSGRLLAVAATAPGAPVITVAPGETVPNSARWELIEQVTTNSKCERHPTWKPQANPARVTTCHVLLNRANGEALTAASSANGYAVNTDAVIDADGYWNLSDIAPGVAITLGNATLRRYLADTNSTATTISTVTSASRWILTNVDAGCEPLTNVRIDSHEPGALVDTSETGNATGSFFLAGVAPADSTSIVVEVEDESAPPIVVQGECAQVWSIEVVGLRSEQQTFTVVASGSFGEVRTSISLEIVAPSEDDVLVTPTFANTPQFHDRLVSYDGVTGTLVFSGDVASELQPGDGLGSGVSPLAPSGYLRIVLSAVFDGTNTVVTTRQAGLTELVRQIEIHYQSTAESPDVNFSDTAPDADRESAPSADEPPLDTGGILPADDAASVAAADTSAASVPIGNGAELTLDLNIDPGADFDLVIGWEEHCGWILCISLPTVDEFGFEVSLDLSATFEFDYTLAELFNERNSFGPRLDDYRFATITVPTPIGIPVVVTFQAESQPFYDISIDAVARIDYTMTFSMEAGFQYKSDGTGRGAYRDASSSGGAPNLDFDLGILATVAAGLEIDVEGLLYDQVGIELEAEPKIELEAVGDIIDREVDWELKLVVPFEAGIEIEIKLGPVGWEKEIGGLDILELSLTLFSGTFGGGDPALVVSHTAPPGVFPSQEFVYTITVENSGETAAEDVSVDAELPASGSFVSSSPPGFPASPAPGANFSIPLPDIVAGDSETATIRWKAPAEEETELTNTVTVTSENAPDAGPVAATVTVGLAGRCNPCGAAAGGVGLRNRAQGTIQIAGLPAGATVARAVLTWGILYNGPTPSDTITFAGSEVTADVAATVSGNLCWGDSNTIGYAADVTSLVTGNGSYTVSDPPNGVVRVDSEPRGVLPYTDGASLVVFFIGGGANNQVISDFTYNTNTDDSGTIIRSFDGINSLGLEATLTLAGPDGQNNGSEVFTIAGSGAPITLFDTWDGSASQEGPSFGIGNLWDNDTEDVSSVLQSGQTTLELAHGGGSDCVGISAAVLEVAQG